MNLRSRFNLKKWSVLALVPIVAACSSVGPGMHFDRSKTQASGDASGDTASNVPTVLKPITVNLVKQEKAIRDKQTSQDLSKLLNKASPYNIEGGDILSIVVWDHPELSGAVVNGGGNSVAGGLPGMEQNPSTSPAPGFVVDHQGMIQYPYVGNLKVAGMTEEQARAILSSKLARYINKPNVTLRVQSYRSKRIYVDGEVKAPGLQAINDIPMTLIEALNRAGGMLPTADQSQLALTREGATYHINLPQLVQRGINPAGIMLANGDVVRVRSRDESKVFISGEVVMPRALPMHNGRLTLNEALGESGGINPLSGDARQVYVVRKSSTEPVVYQLDAQAPGALAVAEAFELHPKDVVYVAATPLANWHRTISQLLPGSLSSAVTAASPYRGP